MRFCTLCFMFKCWCLNSSQKDCHKCNHKISFSVASVTIIRRKKKDRMSINKINYFYLNVFLDFFSIRDKWVNYNHSLLRSYYGHRFTWLYCIAILLTDIIKHQTLVTEDPKKIENREASGKKKNPCGARKIENISEPLPDMIGFICYTVIPQAVTRGWSGWGREARE